MSEVKIGFIGLGIMGKPMALNLVRAGYPLVVHSRSRPPVQALVAEGARAAQSPWEVAERTDGVITMSLLPFAIREPICGKSGLWSGRTTPLNGDDTITSELIFDMISPLAETEAHIAINLTTSVRKSAFHCCSFKKETSKSS